MNLTKSFPSLLALSLAGSAMATDIEIVTGENIPAHGPYVPATVAGGVVYTSGQIAFDAREGRIVGDDVRTQTRQALQNLSAVLEAAGSSLQHTLRVNVFLKNPEDFPAMNEVYQEFFQGHQPARTTVPGVEWGKGVLVEVDAIAVRIEASTD
jgi:2-iminobutanoate/2-iminopropanoate deaminase